MSKVKDRHFTKAGMGLVEVGTGLGLLGTNVLNDVMEGVNKNLNESSFKGVNRLLDTGGDIAYHLKEGTVKSASSLYKSGRNIINSIFSKRVDKEVLKLQIELERLKQSK